MHYLKALSWTFPQCKPDNYCFWRINIIHMCSRLVTKCSCWMLHRNGVYTTVFGSAIYQYFNPLLRVQITLQMVLVSVMKPLRCNCKRKPMSNASLGSTHDFHLLTQFSAKYHRAWAMKSHVVPFTRTECVHPEQGRALFRPNANTRLRKSSLASLVHIWQLPNEWIFANFLSFDVTASQVWYKRLV